MKFYNLSEVIQLLKNSYNTRLFVGIAGASGAGKTYFAGIISREVNCTHISMDDYYLPRSRQIKDEKGYYNYDHYNSFEIPLLIEHLNLLKNGIPINKPVYNYFKSDQGRLNYTEVVQPSSHIVIDGLYAFYDELADIVDIKIFVEAPVNERLQVRIARDINERHTSKEKSEFLFFNYAEPAYNQFVIKQKDIADLVIKNSPIKAS